jgi:serine/threonine protein kinase
MAGVAHDEEVTRFVGPAKAAPEAAAADATVVAPLARPPVLGDVVAQKYRLVRSIGRGGMARIFAADHLLLGITVALKLMHPHLARDRAQVTRFGREARAAATLQSANAVRILDVDKLPTGELYMVMEYLEGTSLETLAKGQPFPIADAVMYVAQACDALAEAHERSLIHRDVKPANLFLTKGKSGEPVIKVLDFGLAKSMASTEEFSSSALTAAGQSVGTPHYMAPEQITGQSPTDGRSDVWALGATLYELLTGHLAFGGITAAVIFAQILEGQPAPLRTYRAEVPEPLVAIVERCLMKDPAARFQTARELAQALAAFVSGTLVAQFVAAPLATARFVRSSAPPQPPVSTPNPSVRPSALSLPPSVPAAVPRAVASGPSGWQTFFAALAGPVLLAIAAGVILLITGRSVGTNAAKPRPATANQVIYLTAKSGDTARAKAPPPPDRPVAEKRERARKP